MQIFFVLLSFLLGSAFAQNNIDQKLDGYIQTFALKAMTPPAPANKKLFFLGRDLFFETDLSGNKNISCADCHHPRTMTHDRLPLALGEGSTGLEITPGGRQQKDGIVIARNSPALFNLHAVPVLFWDGRVQFDSYSGKFMTPSELPKVFIPVLKNALAAQALFPMVNHGEMRGKPGTNEIANASSDQDAWSLLFKRVISRPEYKTALVEVFPGEELNLAHVARAIAHFQEIAFSASDTNYDRYLKGDLTALSEIQKIGMDVFFNKGKCGQCHRGEHLTDFSYHNIGTPQIGPGKLNGDDFGRFEQDPLPENLYAFKVPGLRNVAMTAPYMHDGVFKTLAQVIEHYDTIEASLNEYIFVNNYKNYFETLSGALTSTNESKLAHLSPKLSKKLNFEESEEKALVEFIRGALTERRFLDAEISGDYKTVLRLQLTEEGYSKVLANLPESAQNQDSTYYYFDIFTSEGYRLRELETPSKIYFTQTAEGTTLTYRKQLFKSSSSVSGVIGAGTFEDEELLKLNDSSAQQLDEMNNDFFRRLYTYQNDQQSQTIPEMELSVMKNDVLSMNNLWHSLKLKNFETISDEMNTPKEKLFFAPTSTNSKVESTWTEQLNEASALATLQKSMIHTETGGLTTTWSVELKLDKVTKKNLPLAIDQWLKKLVDMGLLPKDAQGSSPSPSKLTEKVLKGMF